MKRLITLVFMCISILFMVCGFSTFNPATAQEPEGGITETIKNGFDFGIGGDVFFPLSGDRQWKLLEGVSLQIAVLNNGLFSINVMTADFVSERKPLYGAGVTVNVPKLFELIKGTWISKAINPSIGFAGLLDLNPTDSSGIAVIPTVHVSIIRYEF